MKSSILLRSLLIVLALSVIGGYTLYESKNLINGPMITLEEPLNGSSVSDSIIEVKGQVKNISFISINDRKITVDEKGVFKEKVLLSLGYNVVKISVNDKFGRAKETLVQLIRTAPKEGLAIK